MSNKHPKMRHCFNCGQDIGTYSDWDPLDNCGQLECVREARAAAREMAEQRAMDTDDGRGIY